MNYRKRNIILLIGFVVSLPILYLISFESTIELKRNLERLTKEKDATDNVSSNIIRLRQQEKYIDSILKSENVLLNNSFQQILLKKINSYQNQNDIEIIEFNNYVEVIDNGIRSQMYPIIIKGNYNSLLHFLNFFEQQGLGEIKSYSFKKKKDYSRRKDYLVLELLLKRVLSE